MTCTFDKNLHPWIKLDYRPHSGFVVVRDECVHEVRAYLLLLGYKRPRSPSLAEQGLILNKKQPNPNLPTASYALYKDRNREWILTYFALKELGL